MGRPILEADLRPTSQEEILAQIKGLKELSVAIRHDIVTIPASRWLKPQKLDDGEIGLPSGPITLAVNQGEITRLSAQIK